MKSSPPGATGALECAERECEDSANPLSLWELLQETLDVCLIRSLLLRLKLR